MLFRSIEEIFGENDFVNRFIWTKTSTPPSLSSKSRPTTEYVIAFEKNFNSAKKYFGSTNDNLDASLLKKTNSEKKIVIQPGFAKFKFIKDGRLKSGQYENIKLLEDVKISEGTNLNKVKISANTVWNQAKLDNEFNKGTIILFKTQNLNPRYLRLFNDSYKAPNTKDRKSVV